jgi:hypothetical protein
MTLFKFADMMNLVEFVPLLISFVWVLFWAMGFFFAAGYVLYMVLL